MTSADLAPVWPDAPRHVPDLPLPAYRFVPGRHPHPRTDPRGSLYGLPEHPPGLPAARWREDRSWLAGVDLYHLGYLWEAHEAWEAVFFATDDPRDRSLVQGLIQLAAALLQHHRGVANGVRRLVSACAAKLERAIDPDSPRLRGVHVAVVLVDVAHHFAGALGDDATDDSPGALTVRGPPPRLLLADD